MTDHSGTSALKPLGIGLVGSLRLGHEPTPRYPPALFFAYSFAHG